MRRVHTFIGDFEAEMTSSGIVVSTEAEYENGRYRVYI